MSKEIAVFGGSFNPPHEGHREIVRRLAGRKGIAEVWIVPVFRHPFGKKLAPFSERFRLCRSYFRGVGAKVKVKDFERRLGGTSWTIRLIRTLKRRFPRDSFSLVLGADAWRQRKKWQDFETIQKEVSLIVFPRGRRSPIPDVSSTEIRKGL